MKEVVRAFALWRCFLSLIGGRIMLTNPIVVFGWKRKRRGYFLKKRDYELYLLYASSLIGRQLSMIWCHSSPLI